MLHGRTFCYSKNKVRDNYFRQNFSQRVDVVVKDINYENKNKTEIMLKKWILLLVGHMRHGLHINKTIKYQHIVAKSVCV